MHSNNSPSIETIIREYIEQKDRTLFYGRKKIDAEKEYNKLLTKYDHGEKQYSLTHANDIYKAYCDMIAYGEECRTAESKFMESEARLKEIGRILFEATITAEIPMTPPLNGGQAMARTVRVSYDNGQVIVN